MMKKIRIALLLFVFVFNTISASAVDVNYTISGTTVPGKEVSIMITENDADMTNLTPDKIKKLEVVTASPDDGSYSAQFKLKDAEIDANGNITNFKLHSNLDNLDITSGMVQVLGETGFSIGENQLSVDENGIVFVPLVETFKKLNIDMKEIETGVYEGFGKNGEIIIKMGEDTAEVDWVDIELPAPAKYVDGVAMVPAYLIEDAARTTAPVYNKSTNTLRIEYPDENAIYEDFFSLSDQLNKISDIEGTVILDNNDLLYNSRVGGSSSLISKEIVPVTGESFTQAVSVNINPTPDGSLPQGHALRLIIPSPDIEIKAGEVAVLSFKARATYATDETRAALTAVQYERSDWQKALDSSLTIQQGSWQQFDLLVYSDYYDMWAGSNVYFNLGGKPQTLEIADFSVTYYGGNIDVTTLQPENPYKGMGDDALWRKEAYRRIDKYRKDDTSVVVTDSKGNPVDGAIVDVKQTKNDYMFGIAVVADEVLDLDESTKAGKIRKDILENSCNTLVCGMEMKSDEMVNNDGINGIKMANEFLSLGKRIRGHTIFWDGEALLNIEGYEDMPYDEAYRKVMDYVIPAAQTFKGKIAQWDVLNEILEANFTRGHHNTTRLYTDVIKKVKEIDPDVKLYVNETGFEGADFNGPNGRIAGFRSLIERMKAEGAPIDGIGIQAHCTNYYYPQGFYIQLDQFAEFVDEIAVTEYDFRNVREEFADEHLRDMLLVTYSHPKTTCFTIWGYYDPLHWRQSAPFYDASWNEKPAKAVWDNMVNKEFMTNTILTTDNNGKASFRGFLGDYEITVRANGYEKTVPYRVIKDFDNSINVVVDDGLDISVSAVPQDTPEPITYADWNEARDDYFSSNSRVYDGVIIESTMDDIAASSVIANGNVNLDEVTQWKNGKTWGTYYGTSEMLKDDYNGTLLVEQSQPKDGVNLRHHIASDYVTDNCDLEMSYILDTLGARTNSYSVALVMRDTADKVFGYLKNDSSGYYIETLSGKRIDLADNSHYDIVLTLVKTDSGYDIKYEVIDESGECVNAYTEKQSLIDYVSNVESIALKLKSAGSTPCHVFRFVSARLKYSVHEPVIRFSDLGYANTLVRDSLKNFDFSNVEYVENPMNDKTYTDGSRWIGLDKNYESGLKYENKEKYLWTTMPADTTSAGEKHGISKYFLPADDSDELVMTAKVKIPKLASFYASPGYAKISVGSADGSIEKDILKLRVLGNYQKHELLLLNQSDDTGETMYHSSAWNGKKLYLTLKLTKNSIGSYDAVIGLFDTRTNDTLSYSVSDFITADEISKIDTMYISSQKTGSGNTTQGTKMFGIKDIVFTCTGKSNPGDYAFDTDSRLALDFDNITEWPFDARLIVAAYKDDKVINVELISYDQLELGDGELYFVPEECGQDYFKVFVWDDMERLVPYKTSEAFTLNTVN